MRIIIGLILMFIGILIFGFFISIAMFKAGIQ